jgi:hypothetical protein
MRPTEHSVTSAVCRGPQFPADDDASAPRRMDIGADVRAQRLRTQPVRLEGFFDRQRRHASVTREDFAANENWLFDLLASWVPFGEWEEVFVTATVDAVQDAMDGPFQEHVVFERREHGASGMREHAQGKLEELLREDILALILEQEDIDDGWEDRVPDREWAFVIRRASPQR